MRILIAAVLLWLTLATIAVIWASQHKPQPLVVGAAFVPAADPPPCAVPDPRLGNPCDRIDCNRKDIGRWT